MFIMEEKHLTETYKKDLAKDYLNGRLYFDKWDEGLLKLMSQRYNIPIDKLKDIIGSKLAEESFGARNLNCNRKE